MPRKADIRIVADTKELSRVVAEEFVRLAGEAVRESGLFTVALSGGSTPKGLYSLLATPEFSGQVPWLRVYLFWGDERCVPPDHPESNYRMARETLISNVPIPEENVYRMRGENAPSEAAEEYERALRGFFRLSERDLPRFDLILLGLGEDGHVASLFPGSRALSETGRLVTASFVEHLKTPRLTLTLPVLNHGAHIFFLVAGENKAHVLRDVFQKRDGSENLPARRIEPHDGWLFWFVDEGAAEQF